MKILITGAAGRLGRRLARALTPSHELVLGDIAELDDPRFVRVDVTDLEAARAATEGCDAVVHMAMLDWPSCSPEELLRYGPRAIHVHAIGTHHMLRSAVEARIGRFVHISSVSAVDGLPPGVTVDSSTRHYSHSIYGMSKGFGEDLCRMFRHEFGLSIAVLRLGTIYAPENGGAWLGNTYYPGTTQQAVHAPSRVHVDDVIHAIELALEAPEAGDALVHVVGPDSGGQWDLEAARRVYGWAPRYAFSPDGAPHVV